LIWGEANGQEHEAHVRKLLGCRVPGGSANETSRVARVPQIAQQAGSIVHGAPGDTADAVRPGGGQDQTASLRQESPRARRASLVADGIRLQLDDADQPENHQDDDDHADDSDTTGSHGVSFLEHDPLPRGDAGRAWIGRRLKA
jgi:hypothetical protein